MENLFKKNPLFFSFFFPQLVDGGITLLGQNRQYWNSYQGANEWSPAYYFLAANPLIYILGAIVWFVGIYWIFKKLRGPFNLILACAFIAGNSWGSTSWIAKMLRENGLVDPLNRPVMFLSYFLLLLYFLLIGIFAAGSLREYFKRV